MKTRTPTTCPVVFSLDIFGDSWSLIVLRDVLFSGKSHFREFLASEEKIASNILSNRLEALINDGLLTKEIDATNRSAVIYKPTNKALDLLPMFIDLMRWGITYNRHAEITSGLRRVLADPEGLCAEITEKFRI